MKRTLLILAASLAMATPALAHGDHGDDCPDKNKGKGIQVTLAAAQGGDHDSGNHGGDCGH